ncbi:MAG: hypothetical protein JWO03_601 [Bacteroidetes bacterium]|nr:hypothetical protein [Bacteroidota bacterium]
MNILDNIKDYFYQSVLRQRGANRPNRSITNLSDAKTIGIIYDSSEGSNDAIVTKFSEMLKAKGKSVEVMAYLDDKKIDQKNGIPLFNRKAVNWYAIPTDERVVAYCNKNFDLLICAITSENKPLEYMAYTSKAKYRVGPFAEEKTKFYDLMIQIDGKRDLNYLLQQMVHFLENIKYN